MVSQLSLYLLAAVFTVTYALPACTKCPAGGFWTNWKDYTSCSATCGLNGQKIQTRKCTSWSKGCPCSGLSTRVLPCAPAACPSGPACKSPYKTYTNSATGKKLCGNVSRTDNYKAPTCVLTKVFNTCPCPAAGLWSEWTNVGTCNNTCGHCGTVEQKRTCRSASYGCPCPGAKTQKIHCEKTPCAGNVCCNGNKVVKILGTNPVQYQCGMTLPPYELLPLPSCPKTTTKAPTKATTAPKNCKSCTLAQLNALNGNGNGFYTQGSVIVDGTTGCNICGWSCNTTTSMANFKVVGTDMTTVIVNDNTHCGYVNNDIGRYQCSATGVWQFKTSAGVLKNIGKYTCSKGAACTTTTKATTTKTTTKATTTTTAKNCKSCTLAELNALNGNGNGFYTQGAIQVDGNTGCNICGWSCNTTTSMVNFQVLGTDLTTAIVDDTTHCGYINNDNDGRYECSNAGVWQFKTNAGVATDMGKYTCSKGVPCCQSCTLAQLNALNGNGDGFYIQGGVIVEGTSNCNICGWSCNTTTSLVDFKVLGTDMTTVIANDNTQCGYINNDNDGRYQCSSNGVWQFKSTAGVYTDMGKYTCSKGAAC